MTSSRARRGDGRRGDELRPVTYEIDFLDHAEGSVLFSMGKTRVICAATIETGVPIWMRNQGAPGGWVTAEYAMLPRSTSQRTPREIQRPQARSQEIKRLIGRSLRAGVNLQHLQDLTCIIDCDVLQADGGTRTASVTGGYIALALALKKLVQEGKISPDVFRTPVAAVSAGILDGMPVVDLNYQEDSSAEVDLNVVMNGEGRFIEIQGTGEGTSFSQSMLTDMLDLSRGAIGSLLELQKTALGEGS